MQTIPIHTLAVIGSGTMGSRIAFQCALHGKQVHLFDIDPQALEYSLHRIESWLDAKTTPEMKQNTIANIETFNSLEKCLQGVDLLIENVPENLTIKQHVFAKLDAIAAKGVIFLTNSSSIPASRIAVVTNRPEFIFNVNFTDPTQGEYLVEVMHHDKTNPAVVEAVEAFIKEIKCIPIITRREIMGFSFNRVWRAIKRENLHLVGEGYSHFEDLDRAWMLLFNTPWGPFGLMDIIGLDVVRDIEMNYFQESGEERDHPPQFLERMIKAGRLGVKTRHGFYHYPEPEYQQPGWLTKESPWIESQGLQNPANFV